LIQEKRTMSARNMDGLPLDFPKADKP